VIRMSCTQHAPASWHECILLYTRMFRAFRVYSDIFQLGCACKRLHLRERQRRSVRNSSTTSDRRLSYIDAGASPAMDLRVPDS
jgi:hypothetical protein